MVVANICPSDSAMMLASKNSPGPLTRATPKPRDASVGHGRDLSTGVFTHATCINMDHVDMG